MTLHPPIASHTGAAAKLGLRISVARSPRHRSLDISLEAQPLTAGGLPAGDKETGIYSIAMTLS